MKALLIILFSLTLISCERYNHVYLVNNAEIAPSVLAGTGIEEVIFNNIDSTKYFYIKQKDTVVSGYTSVIIARVEAQCINNNCTLCMETGVNHTLIFTNSSDTYYLNK